MAVNTCVFSLVHCEAHKTTCLCTIGVRWIYPLPRAGALDRIKAFTYKFPLWNPWFLQTATAPSGPRPSPYWCFEIRVRHTTLGRTPLDELSVPLQHTELSRDTHPCYRHGSNPQSQQTSSHIPTQWTSSTKRAVSKLFFPYIKERMKTMIPISAEFTAMVTGQGLTRSYLHRYKIIPKSTRPCGD